MCKIQAGCVAGGGDRQSFIVRSSAANELPEGLAFVFFSKFEFVHTLSQTTKLVLLSLGYLYFYCCCIASGCNHAMKPDRQHNKISATAIPRGNSRDDIKSRRQFIKDIYAQWIAEHPDKKIWNKSLKTYVYVKYQSINETSGHAAISYESTIAVMYLTEILENAKVAEKWHPKYNDKNQKPYSILYLMRWKQYRLIVGVQRTTGEYVQYYVGSQ